MTAAAGGLFITGTDTGVGKTVVTAALLRALLERSALEPPSPAAPRPRGNGPYMPGVRPEHGPNGVAADSVSPDPGFRIPSYASLRPVACKPVQTGCPARARDGLYAPDPAVYARALRGLNPPWKAVAKTQFLFSAACSPHLAAALENARISGSAILQSVARLRQDGFFPLVEGAGGLYVPLNENRTMLDLAADLDLPVLLVAANRLGALNHTLLSLRALQSRGLAVAGIAFTNPVPEARQDRATALLLRDNMETVRRLSGLPPDSLIVELPHLPDLARESALAEADPGHGDATEAAARESGGVWTQAAALLVPLADTLAACATAHARPTPLPHSAQQVLEYDRRHLWHPYTSALSPLPVHEAVSAKGCRITLRSGQELIDGMASWWCAIHGYSHPRLVAAMQRQAATMSHVMFGGLTHEPAVNLARKLLPLLPPGLEHIFFADSGSVAVEVAMKMALQYWRAKADSADASWKTSFLALRGGYHGDTMGAMSVCDPVTGMHTLFAGMLPRQLFVERPACRFDQPFDPVCTAALEEVLERQHRHVAAVILEPIAQGAGGMWFYHPEYLRRVRALCHSYNVLLIADEIATGFGRTGRFFACEWAGVSPDILCLGKSLTGGCLTLAATAASREVAAGISEAGGVFMHGPTFMANPLACATASESLDLLYESDWQAAVRRLETGLARGLAPCRGLPGVVDLRVLGGIGVVELDRPVDMARMQRFFVENGVWVRPFGRLVYLMPPYIATEQDLSVLTAAVVRAVTLCRD